MKRSVVIALAILIPFLSSAQLGNLMNKAKSKVNQRIDNHVDKAMDRALDNIEGKKEDVAVAPTAEDGPSKGKQVKAYSKFDFVAGEKILYAEDFSQDAIGELPLTWNSSGKGEVMTMEDRTGKWLRAFGNTVYLSGARAKFGENYTIEFDMMYFFEPRVTGYLLPGWTVGIMSSGDEDPADNSFLREQSKVLSTEINFTAGSNAAGKLETRDRKVIGFSSDRMELGDNTATFNNIVHYAIQVQKTRFRMWINDRKVFDIPRAITIRDTMNQVYFKLEGSNYKEEEIGLFISNLKIATGLPDTRHKLLDEGKFSTTGILFDVNTSTIRSESNGVLKEIADAIKSRPDIRIRIVGHTDSDGSDAANLQLSQKRAEAVKQALIEVFNVSEEALLTDGKGETQPVGDNKTREGKAQNRRVEFIKL